MPTPSGSNEDADYSRLYQFIPWACLLLLFVLYVATHGAGLSSVLTVVFFSSIALSIT